MNRSLSHQISILKDTNRIVGSSEIDWATVRPGSYFRLRGDPVIYTVAKTNKIFFIKDFEVLDIRRIRIHGDIDISLAKRDSLSISYKEYELLTVIELTNPGKNYKVGDILSLDGGELVIDIATGLNESAVLTVEEVNENGSIVRIGLKTIGKYIQCPPKKCVLVGGSGSEALFEVEYKLLDDRKLVEGTILGIDVKPTFADIFLEYPLPKGLKEGKLSVKKWEIILSSNYVGESKFGVDYDILVDFTPTIHIPLMAPGSFQSEAVFNKAMNIIEEQLVKLNNRIGESEPKQKT